MMVQWSTVQFDGGATTDAALDVVELVLVFETICITVVELVPIFTLSNHKITRCGTNCGIGTPNTFFGSFITSVVSIGNRSKFNRNADTGDNSFIAFVCTKLILLHIILGAMQF